MTVTTSILHIIRHSKYCGSDSGIVVQWYLPLPAAASVEARVFHRQSVPQALLQWLTPTESANCIQSSQQSSSFDSPSEVFAECSLKCSETSCFLIWACCLIALLPSPNTFD